MNKPLLQQVLSSTRLPTPAPIAMRVIEMTDDPNCTPKQLTDLVQADTGLSSKILRTVNSAFYGLATPVATIERAQILLGLSAIKTLTLGFSLVQSLKGEQGETFDYTSYWKRSVHAAACAKSLAARTKCMEPEEALLGGLLQDVGMVVLSRTIGDEYNDLIARAKGRHAEVSRLELQELDITHAVVGATLAERWRFPAGLVAPVRYHEQPTAAPKSQQTPARCVGLASLGASALCDSDKIPSLRAYLAKAKDWFALESSEAESALEEAAEGARQFAKLLDVDAGQPIDAGRIFEMARDRMITGEVDSRIEEAVGAIRQRQMVDQLTGAASRRAFLDRLEDAFARSLESEGTLTVATIDVDAFRTVNESHGREVGDRALVRIADRLGQAFESYNGDVARIGGETFAVLLPGVDSQSAARVSRELIESFDERPVTIEVEPGADPLQLKLSVRVGVATQDTENRSAYTQPLALLKAAETALEAAREAGGRAVRAFVPRLGAPT